MAEDSLRRLRKGTCSQTLFPQLSMVTPKPSSLDAQVDSKSIFLSCTRGPGCEHSSAMSLHGTRTYHSECVCAKPDVRALCASAQAQNGECGAVCMLTLVLISPSKFVAALTRVQASERACGCTDAHIRLCGYLCVLDGCISGHTDTIPQAELTESTRAASAAPTPGTRSANSVRKPGLA